MQMDANHPDHHFYTADVHISAKDSRRLRVSGSLQNGHRYTFYVS